LRTAAPMIGIFRSTAIVGLGVRVTLQAYLQSDAARAPGSGGSSFIAARFTQGALNDLSLAGVYFRSHAHKCTLAYLQIKSAVVTKLLNLTRQAKAFCRLVDMALELRVYC
jgi:hypothetical protein